MGISYSNTNQINDENDENICNMGNNIDKIVGLKSNSASPTDTWIITFKKPLENFRKGFLKIFINNSLNNPYQEDYEEYFLSLKYELNVYQYIIKPLIENNICDNFIYNIATAENCTYQNLLNMMYDNVKTKDGKILSNGYCAKNLNRSIDYMYNIETKRPSINDTNCINLILTDKINYGNVKFNLILNEAIPDNTETFNEWLENFIYNFTNKQQQNIDFYSVLFQICMGCYAMSLSKMVHNDLHIGNIYVITYPEKYEKLYYFGDGESLLLYTKFKVLIYDFDRSYVQSMGENELLLGNLEEDYSQGNFFIENKDIIKICCYIVNENLNDENSSTLIDSILNTLIKIQKRRSSTVESITSVLDTFTLRDKPCFLQTNLNKSQLIEWYDNFNNTFTIAKKIKEEIDKLEINVTKNILILQKDILYCCKEMFNDDGSIKSKEDIEKIKLNINKNIKNYKIDGNINSKPKKTIRKKSKRKVVK